MRCYLAVWTWTPVVGKRQEITMTFWANTLDDARHIAHTWMRRAEPDLQADFTIGDISRERIPV